MLNRADWADNVGKNNRKASQKKGTNKATSRKSRNQIVQDGARHAQQDPILREREDTGQEHVRKEQEEALRERAQKEHEKARREKARLERVRKENARMKRIQEEKEALENRVVILENRLDFLSELIVNFFNAFSVSKEEISENLEQLSHRNAAVLRKISQGGGKTKGKKRLVGKISRWWE